MNNGPHLPSPFGERQPENVKPRPGAEWNNAITRRSFLKRTGGATLATMVTWQISATSAWAGGSGGNSGGSSVVTKQIYPTREKRTFFRPDASVVTPYPATKGSDPNAVDISSNITQTMTATSAVKDKETVVSGAAVYRNNYNNTGVSGFLYEVEVEITYKNVVP